ncbi:hypothetical protein GH733_009629 [Mirounga leonina]|nr:hypothetical protein GH733_009629 [Mirounga leonina]
MAQHSALPYYRYTIDPLPTEGRLVNSCIQARRKCQVDPICNAAYHHLNSCTSSVSTPSPSQELLVPEECREAAQHLRNSSLMSCTCHRRMKNQVACLDIYWTVHLARSLGDFELDVSPYDDTVTRKPWKMNLSKLNMLKPDSDLCLKFAMLCTLNDKCDRLRKAYVEACSGSRCQRPTCLRQLRAFFEKASEPHAQGLLLCPCAPADQGCGQRRHNTIAPSCALPSEAPNCLELRRVCVSDPLCRCRCRCRVWAGRVGEGAVHNAPSPMAAFPCGAGFAAQGPWNDFTPSRLVDFQTHCHPLDILGTCATEHSRCLRAYVGLIGTAMTPNFVSSVNTSIALSCTCRGSGNLQDECEQLEESFSHNPCLSEYVPPAPSPHGSVSWIPGEEKVEAIAAKMRFHSQLFSQDWADSTFSVMEHQCWHKVDNNNINNGKRLLTDQDGRGIQTLTHYPAPRIPPAGPWA